MIELPTIIEPETPYVANIRALHSRQPRMGQKIDLIDESEFLNIIPSRKGGPTCQITGSKGEAVFAHSKYDPAKEAEKWADGVEDMADEQTKKTGQVAMCYIVDGFGLGYHVQALFKRLLGDTFIAVCESDIALIRTALEYIDYSEMLDSGRLIFLTSPDREEIFNRLGKFGNTMMMGMVFTRPLVGADIEFRHQTHQLINEYAAYLRMHTMTLLGNSLRTVDNILHNLPNYAAAGSIDILLRRFVHKPAVIVSAGPSLKKNLAKLKEIRDNVVIIAVQTTLKPLLACGIKPDFVTTLDYHEIGTRFYEGIEDDLSDVCLVAEPKASWKVIDRYRELGPMLILGNDFAKTVLDDNDHHANLPAGTTVAHLAFYLAQYIGADPIIFIGQDLGFTNNVYYSPGTAIHSVWRPEFNRFCTLEMKEWERIMRHREILRKVPGIDGTEIYTDEQMFTYLQQFEKDFAACAVRVIDATGGGVYKRGTQVMDFDTVAARFCTEEISREIFNAKEMVRYDGGQKSSAREQVEKRIGEINEFHEITTETLKILGEMTELVDRQGELNRRMVRLDELRTMVRRREKIYKLVSQVSQAAQLMRYRADRTLDAEGIEGKAKQRRQLQRDIQYVGELEKGCSRLIELLEKCLERFDAVD